MTKKYIAFVCTHNSGRSQMAQACFNHLKKLFPKIDKEFEAISFGTNPAKKINPKIVEPMKKIGVDLTEEKEFYPKPENHPAIEEKKLLIEKAITMGCSDKVCTTILHSLMLKEIPDWGLDNPAEDTTNVANVRDKILGKVLELLFELDCTTTLLQ